MSTCLNCGNEIPEGDNYCDERCEHEYLGQHFDVTTEDDEDDDDDDDGGY